MTAMERPVYYIKGVVRDGAEATQDFVGPLDLILHLLQKNRIAVRDIPLAGILAQFLTWMSSRRALDLEVAGEFISMASHLMLLKTRMLLSEQDQEAQSEMEELIASLEARQRHENYARILAVLPQLSEGYQQGRAAFPKGPEPQFARRVYRYVHSGGGPARCRGGLAGPPTPGGAPLPWRNSEGLCGRRPTEWKKRRRSSSPLLRAEGPRRLTDLIRRSGSRSEATATFLALLELCRGGKIHLAGGDGQPGGLLAIGGPEALGEKGGQGEEGMAMERNQWESAAEAILFALGEPVEETRLAQAMGCPREAAARACQSLAQGYEAEQAGGPSGSAGGEAGSWSPPPVGGRPSGACCPGASRTSSPAALETLAVVAYFQPVTRVVIDQVRGVDSAHSLALLLDRELVAPCGSLDARAAPSSTGRPRCFCGALACPPWRSCRRCRSPA